MNSGFRFLIDSNEPPLPVFGGVGAAVVGAAVVGAAVVGAGVAVVLAAVLGAAVGFAAVLGAAVVLAALLGAAVVSAPVPGAAVVLAALLGNAVVLAPVLGDAVVLAALLGAAVDAGFVAEAAPWAVDRDVADPGALWGDRSAVEAAVDPGAVVAPPSFVVLRVAGCPAVVGAAMLPAVVGAAAVESVVLGDPGSVLAEIDASGCVDSVPIPVLARLRTRGSVGSSARLATTRSPGWSSVSMAGPAR